MLVTFVVYSKGVIEGVQSTFLDSGVDVLAEARRYKSEFPYEVSDVVITVFDEDRLLFDYFDTV